MIYYKKKVCKVINGKMFIKPKKSTYMFIMCSLVGISLLNMHNAHKMNVHNFVLQICDFIAKIVNCIVYGFVKQMSDILIYFYHYCLCTYSIYLNRHVCMHVCMYANDRHILCLPIETIK